MESGSEFLNNMGSGEFGVEAAGARLLARPLVQQEDYITTKVLRDSMRAQLRLIIA